MSTIDALVGSSLRNACYTVQQQQRDPSNSQKCLSVQDNGLTILTTEVETKSCCLGYHVNRLVNMADRQRHVATVVNSQRVQEVTKRLQLRTRTMTDSISIV